MRDTFFFLEGSEPDQVSFLVLGVYFLYYIKGSGSYGPVVLGDEFLQEG